MYKMRGFHVQKLEVLRSSSAESTCSTRSVSCSSNISHSSSDPHRIPKVKRKVMERKFRISPATLRNELENNDVYNNNYLETVLLDEFLTNLVMKEYVWQLNRQDIKCFNNEVIGNIKATVGEKLPTKINREILIRSIPAENNYLVRIGHRIPSADFLKLWRNYDTDHSGYLEIKELQFLVHDFAQLVGEDVSGEDLNKALNSLMSEFDVNKDGRLELEELSHLMSVEDNFMKAFCSRQYLTRKDFDRIFAHYDTDSTGYLDKEEVMALLNDILKYHESSDAHIPVPVLKEVYKEVMKACDTNNSNTIQKCELALLLTSV
ncbi:calbindin-like isoform X2 [Bolinopsis microptera]|uniref:calbindin-like isoform X2 n=1 Tax=Bolinopsis microptera TaxID=2820187 RepID=UPI00307A98D0